MSLVRLALGLGVLTGAVRAEDRAIVLPAYEYPAALPELLTAAEQDGVPTKDFGASAGSTDTTLTFLVSLRKGEELQQWVLGVAVVPLTEKETQLPPLEGFQLYSSTGADLRFSGRREAVAVTLVGPMRAGATKQAPEIRHRRLLVNADYLATGFAAACEAVLSLRQENASRRETAAKFDPKIGKKPYPDELVKSTRTLADQLGYTPERERALVGAPPALGEFLKLVVKTPGLQDILREVMEVSWWSMLSNGGKTKPKFHYLMPHIRRLEMGEKSNLPQWIFPFLIKLNDKPAMACLFIVTEPRGPFASTAGVIGIQAGRPYDREPQLTVRLIASRNGSASP